MKPKKETIQIIIYGTGGFGREVLTTINDCNKIKEKYKILGFIDDNRSLKEKTIENLPILGGFEWFSKKGAKNVLCVVTISDCVARQNIINKLEKLKVKFATIIHPTTIYSDSVKIGEGTIIQAGCILTINISIGKHVHINIASTIGHDCKINDFVTINPGSHINGNNTIDKGAFIGAGTVTKQGIHVGKWSVIGAGTVLINDVQDRSTYVGVPGKLKK